MGKIITNKVVVNYEYGTPATPGIPCESEVSSEIDRYRIVKTTPKKEIGEDENIYYVITAIALDSDTQPLVITDTLPDGVIYNDDSAWFRINNDNPDNLTGEFNENNPDTDYTVSVLYPDPDNAPNGIKFTVENVKVNTMVTIRFSAKPKDGEVLVKQSLINKAVIKNGTTTVESNQVENVYGFSNISVTKESVPESVICGQTMSYIFTIENAGNVEVTELTLTDVFDKTGQAHFEIKQPLDIKITGAGNTDYTEEYDDVNSELTISNLTIPAGTVENGKITPSVVIIEVPGKVVCS